MSDGPDQFARGFWGDFGVDLAALAKRNKPITKPNVAPDALALLRMEMDGLAREKTNGL